MTAVILVLCLLACAFAVICAVSGKGDAKAGTIVLKTAQSPPDVADILHIAAREMGANVYRRDDGPAGGAQDNSVVLHGRENGIVWAVQIYVRAAWGGSSVELAALGGDMSAASHDAYCISIDRRDILAHRLREWGQQKGSL